MSTPSAPDGPETGTETGTASTTPTTATTTTPVTPAEPVTTSIDPTLLLRGPKTSALQTEDKDEDEGTTAREHEPAIPDNETRDDETAIDAPLAEATPTDDTSTIDAPVAYVPTTVVPTTDALVPTTDAPVAYVPNTTVVPTTDALVPTDAPVASAPTTDAPVADVPTSYAPTANAPTYLPADDPSVVDREPPRRARMRTVVLGLVLLAIAVSVLIGQTTDISVDAGAVFLGLMIGGGVLLLVGARRS